MVGDAFVWVLCGLGLTLVLTATLAVWSAGRSAGQDDRRLERTEQRMKESKPPKV